MSSSTLCHVVWYVSTKVPWGHVSEHSKLHRHYHKNPKFHRKISFCSHWFRPQNSLSSLRNINHLRHWPRAVQCHLTQSFTASLILYRGHQMLLDFTAWQWYMKWRFRIQQCKDESFFKGHFLTCPLPMGQTTTADWQKFLFVTPFTIGQILCTHETQIEASLWQQYSPYMKCSFQAPTIMIIQCFKCFV